MDTRAGECRTGQRGQVTYISVAALPERDRVACLMRLMHGASDGPGMRPCFTRSTGRGHYGGAMTDATS